MLDVKLVLPCVVAGLLTLAATRPVAAQQTVQEKGLCVRVGETVQILPASPARCAYVGAKKLPGGDIVVTLPWPRTGKPIQSVRSSDGGRTWRPSVSSLSEDGGTTWRDGPTPICDSYLTLANGQIIGFDFPGRPDCLWTFNADGTRGVLHKARVGEREEPSLFAYQHTMVQLADGRLLATSQVKRPGEPKSRVPIHISADGGLTWRLWSTAAFDLFSSHRQEGFTEPRLLRLPNGQILCFLRTANPDTAARNGFAYAGLEVTRSNDDGKSGSAPMNIVKQGVYPTALVMQNGVIALAYGRPGNNLIFSADNGDSWICDIRVADTVRAPDCGHYNSIVEVSPGTLLLAYATAEKRNEPSAIVLGTFVHVEKPAHDNATGISPPAKADAH